MSIEELMELHVAYSSSGNNLHSLIDMSLEELMGLSVAPVTDDQLQSITEGSKNRMALT